MASQTDLARRVIENVERVILGKHAEVELVLAALVSQGHVLIEDVPGVGKTTLAKAFAQSIGSAFSRIQFTPDMLPSDISGVSIFNQKTQEFEFRAGPIHAQIVLADEVNRATPKTQAALLEAMDERQVTVDGTSYALPSPFLVMATENPIEYEGDLSVAGIAARPVLHAYFAGLCRPRRRIGDHRIAIALAPN